MDRVLEPASRGSGWATGIPTPGWGVRGLRRLRRAGVEVVSGVRETECREQHRGFLSAVQRGRPFVMLKLAASLDGRIATAGGESRWITGPGARAAGHALRRRVDAVWVGSGTALADDPALTAPLAGDGWCTGRCAWWRIHACALPPDAALLRGAPGSAWVLCGEDAPERRGRALEAAGARVLRLPRAGTATWIWDRRSAGSPRRD